MLPNVSLEKVVLAESIKMAKYLILVDYEVLEQQFHIY